MPNQNGHTWDPVTKRFIRSLKTQKRRSNKIYNSELTVAKIENQVYCKDRVDSWRTRLTLIEELTWSNLGLIRVVKK